MLVLRMQQFLHVFGLNGGCDHGEEEGKEAVAHDGGNALGYERSHALLVIAQGAHSVNGLVKGHVRREELHGVEAGVQAMVL